MKFRITKRKTLEMKNFSDKEWVIADEKHFGKSGRWKEENNYISVLENETTVGMLHYLLKAGVMEIVTIIVSHEHRERGIGKALMSKAEKIAREKGAHKLFLLTGKEWGEIEFYKKMGFVQTGELRKHYLGKDWAEFTKFIRS